MFRYLLFGVLSVGCNQTYSVNPKGEPDALKAPILFVEIKAIDVGEYDAGERNVKPAVFIVQNLGNAPLIIHDLSMGCGCAKAEFLDKPLEPGESRPLTVRMKQAYKYGSLSAVVTMRTNDPIRPLENLQVIWSLAAPFVTKPERVHWTTDDPSQASRFRATIEVSRRKGSLPPIAGLQVEPSTIVIKKRESKTKLYFDMDADPRSFQSDGIGGLVVRFNEKDLVPLTIPIEWRLGDRPTIAPETVFLRELKVGKPHRVVVLVKLESNKPSRVVQAASSSKLVRCVTQIPTNSVSTGKLEFEILPDAVGHLSAEVRVTLAAERQFECVLRIAGVIQ